MSVTERVPHPTYARSEAGSSGDDLHGQLKELIDHAAHFLPAQGPITAFVHHNTLHAFEDGTFEDALRRAAAIYRCQTVLPEEEFRRLSRQGRIDWNDVEEVLLEQLGDRGDQLIGVLGTRYHLRLALMRFPPSLATAAELHWLIAEDDALRRFRDDVPEAARNRIVNDVRRWYLQTLRYGGGQKELERYGIREAVTSIEQRFGAPADSWDEGTWQAVSLHLVWHVCQRALASFAPPPCAARQLIRHRDLILHLTGEDSDWLVNEVLIRWSAAFIDQGLAIWQMPHREEGFYWSFLRIYGQRLGPPQRWLRGLGAELRRLRSERVPPLESIRQSLEELGVPREEWADYLQEALLALRGFAGQIWQMEQRGDRVHWPAPAGSLVEFLAVRLLLDRYAVAYVVRQKFSYRGKLAELRSWLRERLPAIDETAEAQRLWAVFQLAQALGWTPRELVSLRPAEWDLLVREVESFSSLERRLVWLQAYERKYYRQTLDALCAHDNWRPPLTLPIRYQVITCIDEREESFRRHLEEVDPQCETFGMAGFFGVAMYFRGIHDPHFQPLCPVVIRPQTYVREYPNFLFVETERLQSRARRGWGAAWHRLHVATRSLFGGMLAGLLGALATAPLVMRVLFPRWTASLRRVVRRLVSPPLTKLELEYHPVHSTAGRKYGFTVEEMAHIVGSSLRTIGLTDHFSELILVIGHGSSSLNNPHESAHDCGACGGARGGPNARAFAQMANDLRVRRLLAESGLIIPDHVYFVGGYHNTCDDSVSYFDLDRLPATHYKLFQRAQRAIEEARQRNAHERCRRFMSADLSMSPSDALRHVEARAEDLSQTRPEYGHCTNAVCVVGRRERTRGLFMDRRAFLTSYDCRQDPDQQILRNVLRAVVPVCAGISLEYYFSRVDPVGFGCATKLPHNITALLGVVDGAASDLRTGLPWQMVEIHEPMRILFVIETTPEALQAVFEAEPQIAQLVNNRWVTVATIDPHRSCCHLYRHGRFEQYNPTETSLPEVSSSLEWYRGWRDHLGYASVRAAFESHVRCEAASEMTTDSSCLTVQDDVRLITSAEGR